MTTPLAQLVVVRLVADANTPSNLTSLNNRLIGIDPIFQVPERGEIAGIPGRREPGTPSPQVTWNWVMTGPYDPVGEFVDTIPAPDAWVDQAARDVWVAAVRQLVAALPAADRKAMQNRLPLMYDAAAANDRAVHP